MKTFSDYNDLLQSNSNTGSDVISYHVIIYYALLFDWKRLLLSENVFMTNSFVCLLVGEEGVTLYIVCSPKKAMFTNLPSARKTLIVSRKLDLTWQYMHTTCTRQHASQGWFCGLDFIHLCNECVTEAWQGLILLETVIYDQVTMHGLLLC